MNIRELINKRIIGWLCINENFSGTENNRAYVYPQYYIKPDGSWSGIDSEIFPEHGAIEVYLAGNETAEQLLRRLGPIVELKMNNIPLVNEYRTNNKYFIKYNRAFGSLSEIEFNQFNNDHFIQLITMEYEFDIDSNTRTIMSSVDKIYSKAIMVEQEEYYYGPFLPNVVQDEIALMSSEKSDYHVGVFMESDMHFKRIIIKDNYGFPRAVFVSSDAVDLNRAIRTRDWIDEKKLVEIAVEMLKTVNGSTITRAELRQIQSNLDEAFSIEKYPMTQERYQHINNMIHRLTENQEFITHLTYSIFEDDQLMPRVIQTIIDTNFTAIEDKFTDVKELKVKIQALQMEQEKLEKFVQSGRYMKTIEELQDDVKSKRALLKDIATRLSIATDLEALVEQRQELNEIVSTLKETHEEESKRSMQFKRIVDEATDKFKNEVYLAETMVDKVLIEKVMEIVEDKPQEAITRYEIAPSRFIIPHKKETVIEAFDQMIRIKANRSYSKNEIINIIICLTQGFITTFAGEPGTGKTSVCQLIAKGLGLNQEEADRYVEIPVERGWTSHKDYIGYYNPLTKTMEKSNHDVFNAFEGLNNESFQCPTAPFIFLLDEANLSQIEHYWAAFLRLCDRDSSANATISLGGDIVWNVPKHVRFLATVNFDHTTEELSPRFLDRSWMITMEPDFIYEDHVNIHTIEPFPEVFDFFEMCQLFECHPSDRMDEMCKNKWEEIQKVFKEQRKPIMPRNLKMVREYVTVASQCMVMNTAETKLAPVDYAVAQKILPLINGMDKEELVNRLIEVCKDGMPKCHKHLIRMRESADMNMGYYQFFTH